MDWKTLLACITGSVEEELLLRNEYLVTENRLWRHQVEGRVQLTDAERQSLAEIAVKLGKEALEEVASRINLIPLIFSGRITEIEFDRINHARAPRI